MQFFWVLRLFVGYTLLIPSLLLAKFVLRLVISSFFVSTLIQQLFISLNVKSKDNQLCQTYHKLPDSKCSRLHIKTILIRAGREGFQPGLVFQEDCQICWRANDTLGIYCILCGIDFISCSINSFLLMTFLCSPVCQFGILNGRCLNCLGSGGHKGEGICYYLLHFFRTSCKVCRIFYPVENMSYLFAAGQVGELFKSSCFSNLGFYYAVNSGLMKIVRIFRKQQKKLKRKRIEATSFASRVLGSLLEALGVTPRFSLHHTPGEKQKLFNFI